MNLLTTLALAVVCVNGTVASYIGTSCSQGPVTYTWTSYTCASVPASICASLGVNGSAVNVEMDPHGPATLLIGDTTVWNVTANQQVNVKITGTVSGATGNQSWPHFNPNGPKTLVGQTGDGAEDNRTTVSCGAGCLDSLNGVDDIPCSAVSPSANCKDQGIDSSYPITRFTAASTTSPYPLTIEVSLSGGKAGTATLYSVGTHLGVMGSVVPPGNPVSLVATIQ